MIELSMISGLGRMRYTRPIERPQYPMIPSVIECTWIEGREEAHIIAKTDNCDWPREYDVVSMGVTKAELLEIAAHFKTIAESMPDEN